MARPDQALFERLTGEEAASTSMRRKTLATSLGISFNASGATEPGESLARKADENPWSLCRRPWTVMYFTANGRALPCCIAPFSQKGYENYTLGDATQADLARDLERPGLPGLPRRPAVGCAAQVLRQLRPALEPVACRAPAPTLPSRSNVSAIIPASTRRRRSGLRRGRACAGRAARSSSSMAAPGDRTAERAAAAGARVIVEPRRGYGRALMSGIGRASAQRPRSCSSSTATAATGPR